MVGLTPKIMLVLFLCAFFLIFIFMVAGITIIGRCKNHYQRYSVSKGSVTIWGPLGSACLVSGFCQLHSP